MNGLFAFLVKQFAGQISGFIATLILAGVTALLAWAAHQYPPIANAVNPGYIADGVFGLVMAVFVYLSNDPEVAVKNPLLASLLKSIATAKAASSVPFPISSTTHDVGSGVTVTVKPAGPPISESHT